MRKVVRVICPHPPDPPIKVAEVLRAIQPGSDPEYEVWPIRRDGRGTGSAIYRLHEERRMWDLRCEHHEHTAPGGLTAQLSRETVTRLVALCAAGGADPPHIVTLPTLVTVLRRGLLVS